MEEALHEIPLAIFTTLAPIGAGAFITLAVAFCTQRIDDAKLKAIDKFTIIPILVAGVGMLASFAHLTQPLNALNVANTLGETPMANEITAFGTFLLIAFAYWLCGISGKMNYGTRKVFSICVAVLALVFAVSVGMAYMLETIPTWNNIWTPLSIIGFCVFGGSFLGLLVLQLADAADDALRGSGENTQLGVFSVGAVLALVAVIALFVTGATAVSPLVDVAANTGTLIAPFVFFIILAVVAYGVGFFSIKLMPTTIGLTVGLVLVIIAVFLARLVFYGMQIGVAL